MSTSSSHTTSHVYVCQHKGCTKQFDRWTKARKHMQIECSFPATYEGKPKIKDSSIVHDKNVVMPTEEQLVKLVTQYYNNGPNTSNYKRHVIAVAVRPVFGHFPFARFGFGTFIEFAKRNNLEVYSDKEEVEEEEETKGDDDERIIYL